MVLVGGNFLLDVTQSGKKLQVKMYREGSSENTFLSDINTLDDIIDDMASTGRIPAPLKGYPKLQPPEGSEEAESSGTDEAEWRFRSR